MKPDKTILLTGASGVVGSALLPELADTEVHCLIHRQRPTGPSAGCIRGDVTQPRLGLDRRSFSELAARRTRSCTARPASSSPPITIWRAP